MVRARKGTNGRTGGILGGISRMDVGDAGGETGVTSTGTGVFGEKSLSDRTRLGRPYQQFPTV
jgi:hypothetical protein